MNLCRYFCLIAMTILLVSHPSYSQVDTEFWFAPPEVTSGHGDNPLYLRLSTLDRQAVVRVIQPGRANLLLAQLTIPANTTSTVNLTPFKVNLETIVPGSVMKTGFKIESSAPITAYYEVGAPWNSDIFALKGKNALGNRFVIPGQNIYNNSSEYSPTPFSSVDIVATSNNTVVKVKPTRPMFGHVGDTVIIIKLNAGETYSLRKMTTAAADNPIGTLVESNKPIAITLKDDSVINGGCRDMLGDQLVPVEVAGNEYVVLRGFLQSQEYIFITAIEDDTDIFINGSNTSSAHLESGRLYRHAVGTASTYIRASKPVYVFHVTGFGCEMGMAILPSINCKGSTQIGFSRTTDEFFGLNVLVRKEGIAGFRINGTSTLIPSTAFTPVAGSDDKWYTAQLSFSTSQIGVGQASLITNTQNSFQIGIINGNASTTCKYGYFSAFSTLFIGDDFAICEGQTATLDAGADKESYLWSTGATSQTISITDPGEYWVKIVREECVLYDTVAVDVRTGQLDIASSVSICPGDTSSVDGKENFSWQWSNGSTERFLETTVPGKYWVSVFDYTGCQASDTVFVSLKPAPTLHLGQDKVKCPNDTIALNAFFTGATYLWSTGSTLPQLPVVEEGEHWVKVTFNGCISRDTVLIENRPGPSQDSIYGSPSVCPFLESVAYNVEHVNGSSYQWFVRGGTIDSQEGEFVRVDWRETNNEAIVKAIVTDAEGCAGDTIRFPVRINPLLVAERPVGPDTLCINYATGVSYSTPLTNGSVYTWNVAGGLLVNGQGTHEVEVDWIEGLNSISLVESSVTSDTVCSGTSQELDVFVFKDNSSAKMLSVSIDTTDSKTVHVNWDYVGDPHYTPALYWQLGTNSWENIGILNQSENLFTFELNEVPQNPSSFFIGFTNQCDEVIETEVHQVMHLSGVADTLSNTITITWNPYVGWEAGVSRYEIWRKLDDDSGYSLTTEVSETTNHFSGFAPSDAFNHQYVVRAVSYSDGIESWSDGLNFQFDHPLFIPNVFTPNGDGLNDAFTIRNIHLYERSTLTIVDRWGKEVYHARGYQNDWNGEGQASGIYFYTLFIDGGLKLKGILTVFR